MDRANAVNPLKPGKVDIQVSGYCDPEWQAEDHRHESKRIRGTFGAKDTAY
jgi:hypothetical protein